MVVRLICSLCLVFEIGLLGFMVLGWCVNDDIGFFEGKVVCDSDGYL